MILFELTVGGFDDTVTYHVVENGVLVVGFNLGHEKSYSYSHQQFYDRFCNSENHKLIINFLIEATLVDGNVCPDPKELQLNNLTQAVKTLFESLIATYQKHPSEVKKLWEEIVVNYSNPQRDYHTLRHLHHLFAALEIRKDQLMDWDVVQFAVFYHDIVYDVSRHDNEEQSASWAERVMQSLHIESRRIERCKQHILATKSHSLNNDGDTNLFTDADLSILGADSDTYSQYALSIRKEYSIYTDGIYREGRASVLQKLLDMPTIYKTEPFQKFYEQTARNNLTNELKLL